MLQVIIRIIFCLTLINNYNLVSGINSADQACDSQQLFVNQYKKLEPRAKTDVQYFIKIRKFDAFKCTLGCCRTGMRLMRPLNMLSSAGTASLAILSAYMPNNKAYLMSTAVCSVVNIVSLSMYEFFKSKLKHDDTWLALQYARELIAQGYTANSIIAMMVNVGE